MMNKLADQYHIYDDTQPLAEAAANFIVLKIKACLKQQPRCRIALPGGNTPAACLEALSKQTLPWSQIDWYMGDERCLPIGHAERNDTMVSQTLFNGQGPSKKQFFPIKAELGADKAAKAYQAQIEAFDALDIVILGMGEDGHTASLFPNNKALTKQDSVVAVFNAPKPPEERVSLGLNTLIKAKYRIVLAPGEGKQEALKKLTLGESLPIGLIGPKHWFLDHAAIAD
jgi:6-phosphogluconolactonase